jgi:hypothetical protein
VKLIPVWCHGTIVHKSVGGTPTEAGETPALPVHQNYAKNFHDIIPVEVADLPYAHTPGIFVPQKRHLPPEMSMRVTAKMSRWTTGLAQLGHQVVWAPSRPGTLPI